MTGDTIFALASGHGRAGVAILRVSGPAAYRGAKRLAGRDFPARRAVRVRLVEEGGGNLLDRAMALFFPAPASFTGEDVVELHVHGGLAVIDGVLEALGRLESFRLAEPGEFTRRSFENGKIDLTAAEGVADLVEAETAAQRSQALRQIDGALAEFSENCRARLVAALAHWEAAIDFSDEELPKDTQTLVLGEVSRLADEIKMQLDDDQRGERLRHGIEVVILGPPNAGKSSLLNRLAKRDAAIVSEIAGTTRDVIEVRMDLGGYPVILADTAGLQKPGNEIEREGVRRARARATSADIRIAMLDGTSRLGIDAELRTWISKGGLVVVNKIDAMPGEPPTEIDGYPVMAISAKTGDGVREVVRALEEKVAGKIQNKTAPLVTRQRHRQALAEAGDALCRFLDAGGAARFNMPELAAEDLWLAGRALGRIAGTVDVEDILDTIFADFCIGK